MSKLDAGSHANNINNIIATNMVIHGFLVTTY